MNIAKNTQCRYSNILPSVDVIRSSKYPGSVSIITSRLPTPMLVDGVLIEEAAVFMVTVCFVTFLATCSEVVDPVGDVVDIRRPYTS